ncbi:MAG: transcription-repair coupling factor (superfamily II helicase), partial [Cryomorphaceae bacterium]
MNISELAKNYTESSKTLAISTALKTDRARLALRGIVGSGLAFLAQAIIKESKRDHLFIFNDKEEAAYFLNDLQKFEGKEFISVFYPESFRVPYEIENTDNSNIVLRAEVLKAISGKGKKPCAIVTYPDALAENVVTRKQLGIHTFKVQVGKSYSIEFLNELLTEYEFHRVDFVYEPGQFSIRGGIVDVYSFGEDYPYRIEFFGDEVESLRQFDPVTQLSTKSASKFTVIPNIQHTSMLESRESFLDFIGEETAIWSKDDSLVSDRLDHVFGVAEKQFTKLKSQLKRLPPKDLYISGETFEKKSKTYRRIGFGTSYSDTDMKFDYNQVPQPSFNKNFDLLIQNLQENAEKGYANFLFSSNEKQVERLERIFEDLKAKAEFTPIHTEIAEGFIDKDFQICCYSDHQIFERYHRFYLKEGFKKNKEALTLKELSSLQPGDFVTHIDHGVGKFSGLEKIDVNGKEQEAIRLVYRDNDILYVSIHSLHRISKYSGKDGNQPSINKLGSAAWQKTKAKTKKRVKEIAYDLIKLYAKRKGKIGFAFSPDNYLQTELEASFIYEDTPDQIKSTQAVKEDMESASPMDRLVCGDVGFGKTEIAIRAAFKAVCDSKQVAILVPTT